MDGIEKTVQGTDLFPFADQLRRNACEPQ